MSATLAQLRALTRQAGVRMPAAPARAGLPSGPLHERPRREASRPTAVPAPAHGPAPPVRIDPTMPGGIAALRALLRVRAPAPAAIAGAFDRDLPGTEIAPGLHLVTARLPFGAVPDRVDGGFDRRPDFDPRQVLFFDTETTGLAGGAGTRAFMIGTAHWDGTDILVRQLLIATLAAEPAMLAEFARWLAPDTVLASYNGKSYDAPLLRTRYRLARQGDPLAGLAHVDLLYPSRRRWRGCFENCRLATIEHRVLRIVREDDLPGSEAPAAWLGYLRGGSAAKLRRVAAHNHQDVLSLARLLLHLAGWQAAGIMDSPD